jgi:hypothetical protein
MTWELGGGMGHVTVLRPVACALCRAGHRVIFASRDLIAAERAFADTDVACIQAPVRPRRAKPAVTRVQSYADLLQNVGFSSPEDLRPTYHAWRNLFELVDPDLTLFDHSPTALLASRTSQTRRVLIGNGFFCPPIGDVLPRMGLQRGGPSPAHARKEDCVTDVVNRVIAQFGDGVTKLSDIYSDVDETLLCTFEELDHFGPRAAARYWGAWPTFPGDRPRWPSGPGKRVFAYLKPFPGLPALLHELRRLALPTIVFGYWVNEDVRARFGSETLTLLNRPVDLVRAGTDSDMSILNATHGTTAALLLAGSPILQIPFYQEQRLVAERVQSMGAGLIADRTNGRNVVAQLHRLLDCDRAPVAAARFAERYRDVDPRQQLESMVGRVESLLPTAETAISAGSLAI